MIFGLTVPFLTSPNEDTTKMWHRQKYKYHPVLHPILHLTSNKGAVTGQ
jgi:hypothetical protein